MSPLELNHIVIRTAAPRVRGRPNPTGMGPRQVCAAKARAFIEQNTSVAAKQGIRLATQTALVIADHCVTPFKIINAQIQKNGEIFTIFLGYLHSFIKRATRRVAIEAVVFGARRIPLGRAWLSLGYGRLLLFNHLLKDGEVARIP